MNNTYYLAGPMRGYPEYNFPAFREAAESLRGKGYNIISPHELDEEIGFDPAHSLECNQFSMVDAVKRDVNAIINSHGIILLPGWERSTGATAEAFMARWLQKEILGVFPNLFHIVLPQEINVRSGDSQFHPETD